MAYLFGSRSDVVVFRRKKAIAFEQPQSLKEIEAQIRENARSLAAPATGLILELRGMLADQFSLHERALLAEIEKLAGQQRIGDASTEADPARMQGYIRAVEKTRNTSDDTGPVTELPARTKAGRIKQLRKGAEPIAPNALKLAFHVVTAGILISIEITLFHSALEIAFEPVLGSPSQAISNGILALVCVTAILGGLKAFNDENPRSQKLLAVTSCIAVVTFLTGSALFVGNAIFSALYDTASAANFDVTDTGGIGMFGSLGLALVYGSSGILAWLASHNALHRIRALFGGIMRSIGLRQEAAKLEQGHFNNVAALTSAHHALADVQGKVASLDLLAAQRVSAICANAATAGRRLLTQLDLYGEAKSNLIPDALTEEAMAYDRNVLREKVVRFEAETEPAAILKRLRKFSAAGSPKKTRSK